MCFILTAWGRIDGPGAFIKTHLCPPPLVETNTRAPRRRPGLAGARQICALPSTVVGRLGNRSERSQPSLPPSPEAGLTRANPPTSLQYCLLHVYTPRLSVHTVRPSQTPSPRRALPLSLSLAVCFFLPLSTILFFSLSSSLSLSLSLSLKSRSLCLAQIPYAPTAGP